MPLEAVDVDSLSRIASLIPSYISAAQKLSDLSLIDDPLRRKSPVYRRLRNALGMGRSYEQLIAANRAQELKSEEVDLTSEVFALASRESDFHPFIKVDLVRSSAGEFKIVEVEVNKTHGFGYTTLGRGITGQPLLGEGILERITGKSNEGTTGLILSQGAEFYETEARYFIRQVNGKGGNLILIYQDEIFVEYDGLYNGKEKSRRIDQILTLPLLQESNRGVRLNPDQTISAINTLCDLGLLKSLEKHNPDLSDKSYLGIVSNASCDPELEELLERIFSKDILHQLRRFIPLGECLGFTNGYKKATETLYSNSGGFYVKQGKSSGSHGIAIPGDLQGQMNLVGRKSVIIQEAIVPAFHHLRYVDVKTGERGKDDFSVRYVLFVDNNGQIIDLALTGSPGILAHGSKESVIIPPVIL